MTAGLRPSPPRRRPRSEPGGYFVGPLVLKRQGCGEWDLRFGTHICEEWVRIDHMSYDYTSRRTRQAFRTRQFRAHLIQQNHVALLFFASKNEPRPDLDLPAGFANHASGSNGQPVRSECLGQFWKAGVGHFS
jgi:hypothetical protein